jgi:hypothetical protein
MTPSIGILFASQVSRRTRRRHEEAVKQNLKDLEVSSPGSESLPRAKSEERRHRLEVIHRTPFNLEAGARPICT